MSLLLSIVHRLYMLIWKENKALTNRASYHSFLQLFHCICFLSLTCKHFLRREQARKASGNYWEWRTFVWDIFFHHMFCFDLWSGESDKSTQLTYRSRIIFLLMNPYYVILDGSLTLCIGNDMISGASWCKSAQVNFSKTTKLQEPYWSW